MTSFWPSVSHNNIIPFAMFGYIKMQYFQCMSFKISKRKSLFPHHPDNINYTSNYPGHASKSHLHILKLIYFFLKQYYIINGTEYFIQFIH